MVQWKGSLDYSQAGEKAKHLDRLEGFNVPNFFVVTKKEIGEALSGQKDPNAIRNTQIESGLVEEVKNAHSNIGVTSEIRNASGRAKNLVGNRRESARVSIRVSTSKEGNYCQLNVGSSNIEKALKQVLAEYFEDHDEVPAVLVQKMVEPGHTGAIITDYRPGYRLVESVKGLGTPIEEAETQPETYLISDNDVIDSRLPEKQIEVTRHPVNGKNRKRTVQREESPYRRRKLLDAVSKLEDAGFNAKYVYKRGTFYIVDAEPAQPQSHRENEENLDIIKVAGNWQEINDFKLVEKPPKQENHDQKIVARKGGYTSTRSQQARIGQKSLAVNPRDSFISENQSQEEETNTGFQDNPFSNSSENIMTSSIEVLPLNQGRESLRTKPPFRGKYNIVSRKESENDIPEENVLTSYGEVFASNSDSAIIDSRLVPREGLEEAVQYIDAELKLLIAARVDRSIVKALIQADFDALAVENQDLAEVAKIVEVEERSIMLDMLREI